MASQILGGRKWRGARARTRVPRRFLSVPLGGGGACEEAETPPPPAPAPPEPGSGGKGTTAPTVRPRSSGFRPLGARARRDVPHAAERGEDRVLREPGWGTCGGLRGSPPQLLPDRGKPELRAGRLASAEGAGPRRGSWALSPPAAGRAGSSVRGAGPRRSRDSERLEEIPSQSAPESHYIQIFILGAIP